MFLRVLLMVTGSRVNFVMAGESENKQIHCNKSTEIRISNYVNVSKFKITDQL